MSSCESMLMLSNEQIDWNTFSFTTWINACSNTNHTHFSSLSNRGHMVHCFCLGQMRIRVCLLCKKCRLCFCSYARTNEGVKMKAMKDNKTIGERVVRGLLDSVCLCVFLAGLWYSHTVVYPQKHMPWYRAVFYMTQWQARLHALWCALAVAQQLGVRWPGARTTARLYSVVLDLTAMVSAV